MPRIRNLKPDFFTDADMLDLSPLHRLLFQGLWCWADRAGRLDDKPRELKLRILPGDNCDVNSMLDDLFRIGKVVRYEAEGRKLIAIKNFGIHQRPHKDEKPSEIPGPPDDAKPPEPLAKESSAVGAGKKQGSPGKSPAKTPDHGDGDGDPDHGDGVAGPAALLAIWNENSHPSLPRAIRLTEARKKHATARLEERPLEEWPPIVARVSASSFCRGETSRGDWKADFDWLLKPDTATKVLEGKYDDRGPALVPEPDKPPCVVCGLKSDTAAWGKRYCYEHVNTALTDGLVLGVGT